MKTESIRTVNVVRAYLSHLFVLALTLAPLAWAADPVSLPESRFYRITGPVPVTITGVNSAGSITWTNELTNAVFTVQTTTILGSESNWVDWVQTPITNSMTTHWVFDPNPPAGMAFIPAGNFVMGDTFNEGSNSERPTHTVYVPAFYMDKYEVTKAKWDEVYTWATTNGYQFDNAGEGKATNHPVHSVSWHDVVKWCNARSEKEGQTPAYYTNASQTTVYRAGQMDLQNEWVKWNRGYRLPTEAEWEKATRGGLAGKRFSWGDTISHSQANYYSSWEGGVPFNSYDRSPTSGYHPSYNDGTKPYTSPVGLFAANGYGLYDMAGNVWEWCWDWYGAYGSASQKDPQGPTSGSYRVFRGGSWNGNAAFSRTAYRLNYYPTSRYYYLGFRPVLPPGQ